MSAMQNGHLRRRDSIRDQILDAAEELVRENEAVSFTTRELAQRAGVSLATPFNHFGSKVGVLSAVMARSFSGAIGVSPLRPRDPVEQVITSADQLIAFYAADVKLYRPLFGALLAHREADSSKAQATGAALFEAISIWRDVLEALNATGMIRRGQDLHQLATTVEYQWLSTALAFVHFGLSAQQWQQQARHAIALALVPVLKVQPQQKLLRKIGKLAAAPSHPFRQV